jgi:hypothetical protein
MATDPEQTTSSLSLAGPQAAGFEDELQELVGFAAMAFPPAPEQDAPLPRSGPGNSKATESMPPTSARCSASPAPLSTGIL